MEKIFTTDWTTHAEVNFNYLLNDCKGEKNLRFLEIGSWEGRTSSWLLENFLTHESSKLYCVEDNPKEVLYKNLKGYGDKVEIFEGTSLEFVRQTKEKFDFIYIDGSHIASDVMIDAIVSLDLLNVGGIMLFDDYQLHLTSGKNDIMKIYNYDDLNDPILYTQLGVDYFLHLFKEQIDVIDIPHPYQVAVGKLYNSFEERYTNEFDSLKAK